MGKLVSDQVFCLGKDQYYCVVDDVVFGPWRQIGPARAGFEVEQRRAAKRNAESEQADG